MPEPRNRALSGNVALPNLRELTMASAVAVKVIAMTADMAVSRTSYLKGIGRITASMAMKCMDQMPPPIPSPPSRTRSLISARPALWMPVVITNPVKEPSVATAIDNATRPGL
jgi:hypothetical protein